MTREYANRIVSELTDREVFQSVFFKEAFETDKGIKDARLTGVYISRNGGAEKDETWEATDDRPKAGMYKVIGEYKAVAWFSDYDPEAVVNTLIVDIQNNRGVVTSVTYNPRIIYAEEAGEELRSNLKLVKVEFQIETLTGVRVCKSAALCKEC